MTIKRFQPLERPRQADAAADDGAGARRPRPPSALARELADARGGNGLRALRRAARRRRRGGDRRRPRLSRSTASLPRASSASRARAASTSPRRSRRSWRWSARAIQKPSRFTRLVIRSFWSSSIVCLKRGNTCSSSIWACSRRAAELAHLLEPVRRFRAHLVELVDEGLDIAVLAFEVVGIGGFIGFAKRRIDDHLFLVGMLVERVGQLHQQHLALERLGRVGREHLVEDRERHVVLGSEDLVPVAGHRFHALHQRLAAIVGGEAERDSGKRGAEHRPGVCRPTKRRCDCALPRLVRRRRDCAVFELWSDSMDGFGYAWPSITSLADCSLQRPGEGRRSGARKAPFGARVRCRSSALPAARREAAASALFCAGSAGGQRTRSMAGGSFDRIFDRRRQRLPFHIPRPAAAAASW